MVCDIISLPEFRDFNQSLETTISTEIKQQRLPFINVHEDTTRITSILLQLVLIDLFRYIMFMLFSGTVSVAGSSLVRITVLDFVTVPNP